jgi:hypothetical protein
LTDDEIKAVIAFLQSMGGQVTVTMAMDLHDLEGGGEAAPVAPDPETAAAVMTAAEEAAAE